MTVTIHSDAKNRLTIFTLRDDCGAEIGRTEVSVTARGYGYLRRMHVDPAYRRHGGGRALLTAVVEYFGHIIRLELIVSDHSDVSLAALTRFYDRAGFRYGPSADTSREPRSSDIRRMFRNPR
jgi:GNAT superfamily N-acetyltransferase